jgi:hypothetical protein
MNEASGLGNNWRAISLRVIGKCDQAADKQA